ncbi:MAG TPA: helix-turn-helix domain-containing protein [Bradyrhizobium sp.]|uniref:winged helix-turn-helix transcriptional regulator n=1 Tax=Bradyrhizobium sp. TaxID=376 RepID=UPI002D7FF39D|nr:helix-turn-helix domain-containing protein [Bradyrhizobium sp.]HET7887941.1 helix-turn-helix domain-containing protein [Bradyrhizobium sp.]
MPKPPLPVQKIIGKGRVRGSRTGRPIMVLLDLFGRRWALRILWELRETSMTSRALRGACDEASPTVLNERLKELREAGFVELAEPGGYGLTPTGRELLEALLPLNRFAARWGKERS